MGQLFVTCVMDPHDTVRYIKVSQPTFCVGLRVYLSAFANICYEAKMGCMLRVYVQEGVKEEGEFASLTANNRS